MGDLLSLGEAENISLAGGKGSALAKMIKAGFNVPDGFVVSAAAKALDEELARKVLAEFDKSGFSKVAVRSSAIAEDGTKDAWAGQMDSFLNVKRAGLIDAIEKCRRSAESARAKAYAKQKGLEAGRLAVIIQEMIDGDISGVVFSVNPVTNDNKQMVIEAVRGLADSLVSGQATPDNYLVSKKGELINQTLRQTRPLLSKHQLKELVQAALRLESYFDFPVDVEWTFAGNKLFILQSRPITTLAKI